MTVVRFDLNKFKTKSPGDPKTSSKSKKSPKRKRGFTMFCDVWDERLLDARLPASWNIGNYLMREWCRNGQRQITLTNIAMAKRKIPRWQKHRALAELERMGLVRVDRYGNRNPVVAILVYGPHIG
jgi:hypothetical protein